MPWDSCKEASSLATSLEWAVINPRQAPISTSSSHCESPTAQAYPWRSAGYGLHVTDRPGLDEIQSDLRAEHEELEEIGREARSGPVGPPDPRRRMGGARSDQPFRLLR